MANWTAPIDIYCERVSTGFWAEPANAISNLAFVLAALWAVSTARKLGRSDLDLTLLILLAAMIGVGSFLFHTFATRWSALADVIPIWTFVALCILSAIYRIGGVAPKRILIGALALVGVGIIAFISLNEPTTTAAEPRTAPVFNGSLQYAPAWIAMVSFAVLTVLRRNPVAPWIVAGTLTFTLSLSFRTVDLMWCDAFPLGTHFMWHLLNGAMIGLLLQALLRARTPQTV